MSSCNIFIGELIMWKDITTSIVLSILEALGCSLLKKQKNKKIQNKISIIVSQNLDSFADSSLDSNDFFNMISNGKFIEIMRNYFLTINDELIQYKYTERMEGYIYNECPSVNHNEVREFLKKIKELYEQYLHNIIEDYPDIYALFQLMTISHREIICKISDSEDNLKRYFESLENKRISIDDDNIKTYHKVSEKEYGVIRFTGIVGAERKREQSVNEFYVENTFSYYGKEIEKLYNSGLDEIETIKLDNFFDFGNKIVLIGGAGLGKSTTLNYLYCNYEKMCGLYALKIKVDLKEYAKEIGEKKKSILWCIATEFCRRIKHTKLNFIEIETILADYLSQGKCLVIMDALDEIPTQAIRNKVRDETANFCEIYYLNRFIISTREAGYLRNRFDDSFLHIKINQFNEKQIRKYSENWYKLYYNNNEDFNDFWIKFEIEVKRARCEKLIGNPIILILALVIFDIEKNLPTRRIEFYQKCIDTFLTERENRKAAFVFEEKTKSILSMSSVIPQIAHFKFEHINGNTGFKLTSAELEKSIMSAIGVEDTINWGTAVKQYAEYLVERTELVQEIDEGIYDFAHKTFYEYFLALFIAKRYEDNSLVNLLNDWIGDSNYDELARLIIEVVIQNDDPRKHDFVIGYLFDKLSTEEQSEDNGYDKMDVFLIIVDLYNYNMIHPKFYLKYNDFILYNSKLVDRCNRYIRHGIEKVGQCVQYDAQNLTEIFLRTVADKTKFIDTLDTLYYLNNDFKRRVSVNVKDECIIHMITIFELVREKKSEKKSEKNSNLTKDMMTKEIDYFLGDGLIYTLDYPQIFMSVINLSLELDEVLDINKLFDFTFSINTTFYGYTTPDVLLQFILKARKSKQYLLLLLISIIECCYKKTNSVFEFVIDQKRKRYENDLNLNIGVEFFVWIWKNLNTVGSCEEFIEILNKENLYNKEFNSIYTHVYKNYVKYNKGIRDERIKIAIAKTIANDK